jgi:hypothetical protein
VTLGDWPAALAGRSYRGRRLTGGGWRIDARGGGLADATVMAADGPDLARALLGDAFAGCRVRADLVEAFAVAWRRRLTPCGFRVSAEAVAGWSLAWALDREPQDG